MNPTTQLERFTEGELTELYIARLHGYRWVVRDPEHGALIFKEKPRRMGGYRQWQHGEQGRLARLLRLKPANPYRLQTATFDGVTVDDDPIDIVPHLDAVLSP